MKKSASKVLSALLVLALMLSLSGMAFAETRMYAITSVNVRTGPDTSYYLLGSLEPGEEVNWTGNVSDGWYEILWSSYTNGWVAGNYLSYYDPDDYYYYYDDDDDYYYYYYDGSTSSSSSSSAKKNSYNTYNYNYNNNNNYTTYYCQPTYTRNTVNLKVCEDCGDIYESTAALNVRSGPGTSYSIISSLSRGEKCTVIGKSGNWYKLLTTTGADAYASASYLKLYSTSKQANKPGTPSSKTSTTPTYPDGNYGTYYATTGLNVRQGPSTSYSVVYTLTRGEAVTFTGGTYGKWMSVKTRTGVQGYCSSVYLTKSSTSSSAGSTSSSSTTKYYCSNCGNVVAYGNTYCPYCGSRLSYNSGCTPCTPCSGGLTPSSTSPVYAGSYYAPNYRTPLYSAASGSASVLGYLDCYDTVVVQSANNVWAYVKVTGYNIYGYVPVDAIK